MKKILILGAIMISGFTFGQANKPVLEQEGNLVKATYYYDNGQIQQQGHFKDGKLEGKWMAYDIKGSLTSIAEYSNGIKSGKWIYHSNNVAVRQLDFTNNQYAVAKN